MVIVMVSCEHRPKIAQPTQITATDQEHKSCIPVQPPGIEAVPANPESEHSSDSGRLRGETRVKHAKSFVVPL